jgi:nicotinate phosphoribosyltransferase
MVDIDPPAWDSIEFLRARCPFLDPVYLDFLEGFHFDPEEVNIGLDGENLLIAATGPWFRTILWEVPILAIVSEVYFKHLKGKVKTFPQRADEAQGKAAIFRENGVVFSEFGTRRRYSKENQWLLHQAWQDRMNHYTLVGSSNVAVAFDFDIKPIGTQAHEWFMFMGAKYGYRYANEMALKHWVEVFQGSLGIALTDTYGIDNFLNAFNMFYAKLFDGVRHDSGDPYLFADKIFAHYNKLGINPASKTIVFSDNLDVERACRLKHYCDGKIQCSFGIGTNLTNDVGVKPLNIVIKMTACQPDGVGEWIPTVKLSDDSGKHTGATKEVELCKRLLNID